MGDLIPRTQGDWEQDFHMENGRYECICVRCEKTFYGHKRRVVCSRLSCRDSDKDVVKIKLGRFHGQAAECLKKDLGEEGGLRRRVDSRTLFGELRPPRMVEEASAKASKTIDLDNAIVEFISMWWEAADTAGYAIDVYAKYIPRGPNAYHILFETRDLTFAPLVLKDSQGDWREVITFHVTAADSPRRTDWNEMAGIEPPELTSGEQSFIRAIEVGLDEVNNSNDHSMRRDRPYDGQPHTDSGLRGAMEISGITFRDLRDCYIRAYCLASGEENPAHYAEAMKGEDACLCENDIFQLKGDVDPIAVAQNMGCEIEKLMGIYPNVPDLEDSVDDFINGLLPPRPDEDGD